MGGLQHRKKTMNFEGILSLNFFCLNEVNSQEFVPSLTLRAWTNGKCLATKHHQTQFGDQTC